MLRGLFVLLALQAAVSAQPDAPGAAERARVLKTISEFARDYIQHLPDFVCLRVTQHLKRDPRATEWEPQIKIANELTYYQRQEHYRVVAVNDAPARKVPHLRHWVGSGGDFGGFVQNLFEPHSRAAFDWKGWEAVRGKRAWTFSYRMPAGYVITDCGTVLFLGTCKSAEHSYSGEIYISENDLSVVRLTVEPDNVPENRESRSIDYDHISIAGTRYLLPIADTFERVKDKVQFRNESTYRDYRKFSADSTIKVPTESDHY
jgi:hypothetical protein